MPPPSNLASRPHTPPVRVVLAAQMIAPNGFLAVIGAALRRHSLRALESEYLGKLENEKRRTPCCHSLTANVA